MTVIVVTSTESRLESRLLKAYRKKHTQTIRCGQKIDLEEIPMGDTVSNIYFFSTFYYYLSIIFVSQKEVPDMLSLPQALMNNKH